jgi:hypothetical protein
MEVEIDKAQFLLIFRTKGLLVERLPRITLLANGYMEVYRLHRKKE